MNLKYPVSEIMTTKVVSVSPETPIADIRGLFQEGKFHHVPVVNKEGLLEGIISAADFGKVDKITAQRNWKSEDLAAGDIMSIYPFTLKAAVTIASAIELFLMNRFHALPIVENDRLLGIITTHDILELTMKLQQREEDSSTSI